MGKRAAKHEARRYKKPKTTETIHRTPTPRYSPNYRQGLTTQQVEEHRRDGWMNIAIDSPEQSTKDIIKENVFTYFNLIFAVLTVLLCMVGSFRNLTFLPVIFFNTIIGIIQEIRAKNTLKKLNLLHAPHATVVRDGQTSQINAEELVLDDIVLFKSGNQICADALITEGEVRVNESLLTGESDEIIKKPGDHLLSGSFVVSGKCYARLEKVGADSYISQLTMEAKTIKKGEQSEMIRSLDKLVKFVGIALIPIGIALFVQSYYFNHETFQNSIISMVAAVIGMIPEGLYLLASVALAVSSMRLAQKKVLLHNMKSIETLARVNVLCVDKTGTITENKMAVQKLIPTTNYNKTTMGSLDTLIGDFVKAMDNDNNTMEAMKAHFTKTTEKEPIKVSPFTSATKYSGVQFEEATYVLGAPEFVLREDYCHYQKEIENYAKKGYRVLIFGQYNDILNHKMLSKPVLPLALILLANPIRKEAPETFAYFAEQGVDVKVISGDNPLTVSEAAKEAGIPHASHYVDASTLKTKEDIQNAILQYTVFGRVTPAQKRQLVEALKDQGKTVAMTGDGVNDVLALKKADCSIAMASGSDAAAQAAQVVLLESDFSRMPSVVLEGRRVVNNIQRSASLFLVKNIFSFLLSLFSVAFMMTYPLEPSQISLISMFTIGIPGFLLAFQPNKEMIQGRFLTNVILKALPAGLTDVLAVGTLAVFGQVFGMESSDISTAATMLLAIVGFMILHKICQPANLFRRLVWFGCIVGFLFCIVFVPNLFGITGMSTKCVMLFLVFSIATEPVFRYLSKGLDWLSLVFSKLQGKLKLKTGGSI